MLITNAVGVFMAGVSRKSGLVFGGEDVGIWTRRRLETNLLNLTLKIKAHSKILEIS